MGPRGTDVATWGRSWVWLLFFLFGLSAGHALAITSEEGASTESAPAQTALPENPLIPDEEEETEIVPFSEVDLTAEEMGLGTMNPTGGRTNPETFHFFFAVPEYDSRISLGVFHENGILVRVLAEDVPEEDFEIGLNGLMGRWDGRNDFEMEVPAGVYRIEGYAVGDFPNGPVTSPLGPLPLGWGDAFGEGLPLRGILAMAVGPNNSLILLGLTDAPKTEGAEGEEVPTKEAVVLAFDPVEGRRLWSRRLPGDRPGAWILGRPTTETVVVMGGDEVEVLDPQTGAALLRGKFPGGLEQAAVASLEVTGEELRLSTPSGLTRLARADLQPLENSLTVPSGLIRLAQPEEGALGLDEEGQLWVRDRTWTIFLHEDDVVFEDFWPGREGRFWALVRQEQGGEVRVGQFDRTGEFLRQVTPETFQGEPVALAVGPDEESLYVLVRGADAFQELLGLRKDAESGRWMVVFRRETNPIELLTEGDFRRLPLRMRVDTRSAMESGRETNMLRLTLEGGSVELSDVSGLRLGEMVELPGATAAAARVVRGPSPKLLFRWLSDGRLLEREVSGLQFISRLRAGEFIWPPTQP